VSSRPELSFPFGKRKRSGGDLVFTGAADS
jgi:hypothetical protein